MQVHSKKNDSPQNAMVNYAAMLHGQNDLRFEPAPQLGKLESGKVRIQIKAVGICGSDVQLLKRVCTLSRSELCVLAVHYCSCTAGQAGTVGCGTAYCYIARSCRVSFCCLHLTLCLCRTDHQQGPSRYPYLDWQPSGQCQVPQLTLNVATACIWVCRVVLEVAEGVQSLQVGDQVALEPCTPCWKSRAARYSCLL